MTLTPEELMADAFRSINTGEREGFDTGRHLEHAKRQAEERNFKDVLIVDVDSHHTESESWADIVKYIEDPVIRHLAQSGLRRRGAMEPLLNRTLPSNQGNAGRVIRNALRNTEVTDSSKPRDVQIWHRQMDAIGINYQIVFPTPMLELGMHPDPDIEVAVSWAYNRWLTEEILPRDDSKRSKTMIFLPFNNPDACLRAIEQFGNKPGVVGFMVTSTRYKPVHHNDYAKVYAAIEETGMPIGFHSIFHGQERMLEGMGKFLSVHAIGFVFYSMVHMTNLVINGIPERFPKLKILWIESGLAWVPFMMQRLDHEYAMRTSEAPLLKKKPSEYMREMYYSTQPLEINNLKALETTFEMINAETQLLYSSDYPHWDFDLPSTIWDLPFLTEKAKRRILGENARDLFNLDK